MASIETSVVVDRRAFTVRWSSDQANRYPDEPDRAYAVIAVATDHPVRVNSPLFRRVLATYRQEHLAPASPPVAGA